MRERERERMKYADKEAERERERQRERETESGERKKNALHSLSGKSELQVNCASMDSYECYVFFRLSL